MPRYKVTDPESGQTLTLTGDSPPNEAELNDVFGKMKAGAAKPPAFGGGPQSTMADKPKPSVWPQRISDVARPVLKTAGAVGGALLAGGAATPETLGAGTIPAALAGSGLGYAAGGRVADVLDTALGVKQPETITETLKRTGRDIVEGAPYGLVGPEMGAGNLILQGAKAGALTNAASGAGARAFDTAMGDRRPGGTWPEVKETAKDALAGGAFGAAGGATARPLEAGIDMAGAAARALRQGKGIGGAAKSVIGSRVPEGLPGKMLQKAARIPESNLSPAERAERWDTIAKNGGTFDQAGYDAFNKSLAAHQKDVEAALKPYNNKKVGSNEIIKTLEDLKAQADDHADPEAFLRAINRRLAVYRDTVNEKGEVIKSGRYRDNMTVADAQRLKVQRNRDLKARFDSASKSFVAPRPSEEMAVLDAERAALKNLIERSTGDANIRELNRQEGKLLASGQLLTKAVSKAENAGWNMIHPVRSLINPATRSKVAVGLQNARSAYIEGKPGSLPAPPPEGPTGGGRPFPTRMGGTGGGFKVSPATIAARDAAIRNTPDVLEGSGGALWPRPDTGGPISMKGKISPAAQARAAEVRGILEGKQKAAKGRGRPLEDWKRAWGKEGETYTVKGYDKQGRMVIKNGMTHKLEPWEPVQGETVKESAPVKERRRGNK